MPRPPVARPAPRVYIELSFLSFQVRSPRRLRVAVATLDNPQISIISPACGHLCQPLSPVATTTTATKDLQAPRHGYRPNRPRSHHHPQKGPDRTFPQPLRRVRRPRREERARHASVPNPPWQARRDERRRGARRLRNI
ncbi:hypothetical protein BN1723_000438 [Verticillium longisporum]|uniref:Uncharacterized protein n=1 Tax=Verticillium longisporum TaxID=100787 RepID=A0A0G4MV33_VERLO|nr:hypothetical protein BN1723_000438 [Verticillium longisporum]CRK38196.1 hypothetical protein BN1708_007661 [Verticillium longisporum]